MSVQLQYERSTHRLETTFAAGLARARQTDRPALVSVVSRITAIDPLDVFDRASGDRVFWTAPSESLSICGIDTALSIADDTTRRFSTVKAAWTDMIAEAVIDTPGTISGTGPLLTGGFSFDSLQPGTGLWHEFPAALLRVPRFIVTTTEGESWLTINAVVSGEMPDLTALSAEVDRLLGRSNETYRESVTLPWPEVTGATDLISRQHWEKMIATAVGSLQSSGQEKVVLARGLQVQASGRFPVSSILATLRTHYTTCFTYAFATGDRCLIGATPERLVRLESGGIRTIALAGSTARGVTSQADSALGEELLSSPKNRHEHGIVVRAILDALDGLAYDIDHADTPVLVKVPNVQHLATPIAARLLPGRGILDLVERLHPTPGVGGWPRESALQMIRDLEGLDRGWYAGAIGWLDARGDGDFAVAIRSALLSGDTATLFAGCGIVVGSDPESEYVESGLKLRPMLSALGAKAP